MSVAKCPACGGPAYVGLTKVECESHTCVHGKPKPRSTALDNQAGYDLDMWGHILDLGRNPGEGDDTYRDRLLDSLGARTAYSKNGAYAVVDGSFPGFRFGSLPNKCPCGRDLDLDSEGYCSHCIR